MHISIALLSAPCSVCVSALFVVAFVSRRCLCIRSYHALEISTVVAIGPILLTLFGPGMLRCIDSS